MFGCHFGVMVIIISSSIDSSTSRGTHSLKKMLFWVRNIVSSARLVIIASSFAAQV